jgi:hypothetical protein
VIGLSAPQRRQSAAFTPEDIYSNANLEGCGEFWLSNLAGQAVCLPIGEFFWVAI